MQTTEPLMAFIHSSHVPKNQLKPLHIRLIQMRLFSQEMEISMLSCIEVNLRHTKEHMSLNPMKHQCCISFIFVFLRI